MIRFAFIITAIFISVNCRGQVKVDSLAGTYTFISYTGGGFTAGPNGSCISLPPDYKITTKLTVLPDMTVAKITDTVGYCSLQIHWGCDTLYMGKAKLSADTLSVTYTKKPVCLYYTFAATKQKQEPKRYKKLEAAIIEKYIVQRERGRIQGLKKCDDVWEVYEKEIVSKTE